MGVHDLNFGLPVCDAHGFERPAVTHECRQDAVRAGDGVRAVEDGHMHLPDVVRDSKPGQGEHGLIAFRPGVGEDDIGCESPVAADRCTSEARRDEGTIAID